MSPKARPFIAPRRAHRPRRGIRAFPGFDIPLPTACTDPGEAGGVPQQFMSGGPGLESDAEGTQFSEKGVGNAAQRACELEVEKSGFPAMRKSTIRSKRPSFQFLKVT